jgi:hypothetical protein
VELFEQIRRERDRDVALDPGAGGEARCSLTIEDRSIRPNKDDEQVPGVERRRTCFGAAGTSEVYESIAIVISVLVVWRRPATRFDNGRAHGRDG